ncbi:MAG TPA: PhoU domain-containing protein [Thermoplasmata archaeon]|nr:PhoU domain-containing protein [Thermoplasmata archaeon]
MVLRMEGRKLQLAGGSTYLVSLPKRWVLDAGLKAGDTLFVDSELDGSVSVRHKREERPPLRRKVFEEKGEEAREHLLRKLIGAYISGYGLIEVRFPADRGPFVRRSARDFCRLVIGPEVIEENRNQLIIQDLSDPSELSAEKCLRRMHLITRAMLEDSILALQSRNPTLAHDVTQRSQDVDRLYWMVAKRYLTPGQFPSGPNGQGMGAILVHGLVAKIMERIGYHAVRIAGAYATLSDKKPLEPKLAADLVIAKTSAIAMLDRAFHALMAGDIEEANAAIDARPQHQRLIDDLFHRVATRKGEELLALGVVVDSLGRIASYAADIAEQAINLAVMGEPAPAHH